MDDLIGALLKTLSVKPISFDNTSITFEKSNGDVFTIQATNGDSYTLKYKKIQNDGWNKEIGYINYFDVGTEVEWFMRN